MIRQFVRSILTENAVLDPDWALYMYKDTSVGLRYCSTLFKLHQGLADLKANKPPVSSIIAICDVEKPKYACNDAWEIKAAAGPGKIVYDIGYFLSPTNTLISDRESMTSDAVNAWVKWGERTRGKDLDDAFNPQNSDPNDDCRVWNGAENGSIEKYNYQNISTLPTKAANAVNKSYYKQPEYDWKSIRISLTPQQFALLDEAGNRFFSSRMNSGAVL